MAKLMEVIEKNPDFKKGTVSMRMLDTTFSQLTRKIGTQADGTYKTATTGDILSKELLQSLNKDQLALKEKLLKWQQEYNSYIDSIKSKITGVTNFNYTFTSLVDYTSKYVPNKTLADYYLLTEFVNAEKELYEFGHYWGKNHMIDLISKMKEWSKTQPYGSSVKEIRVDFKGDGPYRWRIADKAGFKIKNSLGYDVTWSDGFLVGGGGCSIYIYEFGNMKIGETRIVRITGSWEISNRNTRNRSGYVEITKNSLAGSGNVDDGYYTFKAYQTGKYDIYGTDLTINQWYGISSPYFDIENPTLQIIKNLVLNK